MASGTLTVNVLHAAWTFEDMTLAAGRHDLKNPSKAVAEAVGAAEDAGCLEIHTGKSDKALVALARNGIEPVEDAMKRQDERAAAADEEAVVTHLMWEIESRCARAVGLPKEFAEAGAMAEQLDLVAPAEDAEVNIPDVKVVQAQLVANAAGIVARLRELGRDKEAEKAAALVRKTREEIAAQ